MKILFFLIDFILHLDRHLAEITATYGLFTYGLLFVIIFVETGLVIAPFLPGDSLLFAAGALASLGSLNIVVIIISLIIAAVLGDTVNYWIGHFFGEKIVANPRIPINQEHLDETNRFFQKHGGKTIILARFVPIVRTFAPFVAGAGQMHYGKFIYYNIIGGVCWVLIATLSGYFFGNIPLVKQNFSLVIIGVIVISVLPLIFSFINKRRSRNK